MAIENSNLIGFPSQYGAQAWSTKNQAVEQMLPPSRFWRGMLPDIRNLPLEVLTWERIEFRRGVGFGVEIQVSTPKLHIGVELLTQLRFHQKYRTIVKNRKSSVSTLVVPSCVKVAKRLLEGAIIQ